MKTYLKSILATLFVGVTLISTPFLGAKAANVNNFYVEPQIPANQLESAKNQQHFELNISKDLGQTIKVKVVNGEDHPIKVQQRINNATTSDNGEIVYDVRKSDFKNDATLQYPLSTLVKLTSPEVLEIAPHSSVEATAELAGNVNADFAGVILGGWNFLKLADETQPDKKQLNKVSITSLYAYNVQIMLAKDRYVQPILKLPKIKVGAHNYTHAVLANLQNASATIMGGLDIDAQVSKANSKKVIIEQKQAGVSIAPNTNFNYAIPYKNLNPGKYHLHLHAQSGQFKWDFDKDFVVTASDVRHADKAALYDAKPGLAWWIIALIIALIIIILALIIFIILLLRRKKDDETDETEAV